MIWTIGTSALMAGGWHLVAGGKAEVVEKNTPLVTNCHMVQTGRHVSIRGCEGRL